eukprot:scaffold2156_cov115-Cylindrotheca_fusiformis.AAC.14
MTNIIQLPDPQDASHAPPALSLFLKQMMKLKNNEEAFQIVVDNAKNGSSADKYICRKPVRKRSSSRWSNYNVHGEDNFDYRMAKTETNRNGTSAPFLPHRRPSDPSAPPRPPQRRASLSLTPPSRRRASFLPPMAVPNYHDALHGISAKFATPSLDKTPSLPTIELA